MSDNNQYRDEAREVIKETNWTIFKIIPTVIFVVTLVVLAGWVLKSAGIIGKNIERNVFKESQSFVESKNTYIARLRFQYDTAEGVSKESFRRLILEEAETIRIKNLTPNNRSFVSKLRNQ